MERFFVDTAGWMAMADAKAKAEQLAKLGGVRLGRPNYINESRGYTPVVRDFYGEVAMPAPAAPTTPISAGEMEIGLSVQVVYGID